MPAPLRYCSSPDERRVIAATLETINDELEGARETLAKVIGEPERYDVIYKAILTLLEHAGPFCLARDTVGVPGSHR